MALKFQSLTRDAIRKLQPGEKLSEHGVTAERQLNGDCRYSVNVMVDRRRVHRVIGRESDGVTRAQAEEAIEKFRTDARADRLDLPKGRKVHRLFKEAAEDYLTRLEQTDGKDLRNKRRHLRKQLIPFLGGERLDKLTEFRLKQYRKHRRNKSASEATINREMATLSHLLHCAAKKGWGWIKKDDIPDIPKVEEERKRIRPLTPEQAEKLLRAAMEDQDPRLWLFVLFATCSMRHSEIVRRRYDEMEWDSCRIWIGKAKAGARQQAITPTLRDALKRQQAMENDPAGWIFPSMRAGSKYPHRRDMDEPFMRAVIRAGLPSTGDDRVTPHVLRHTAITAMVKAKADVPTIQKISGHKTPRMVMHYVHIFGDHIDQTLTTLDAGLPDMITPELHTAPEETAEAMSAGNIISLGKTAA